MSFKNYNLPGYEFNLFQNLNDYPDRYFALIQGGMHHKGAYYKIALFKGNKSTVIEKILIDKKLTPNTAMLTGMKDLLLKLKNNSKITFVTYVYLGFTNAQKDKGINFDYAYHVISLAEQKDIDCKVFGIPGCRDEFRKIISNVQNFNFLHFYP